MVRRIGSIKHITESDIFLSHFDKYDIIKYIGLFCVKNKMEGMELDIFFLYRGICLPSIGVLEVDLGVRVLSSKVLIPCFKCS